MMPGVPDGTRLLAGRVAFVTGAARGIGLAVARRFLQEDARVVLADIDQTALARASAELVPEAERRATAEFAPAADRLSSVVVDVTSQTSLEEAARVCLDRFGRLDVVVANAGILYLQHALDTPLDCWQRVLDVNLTGVFLTCQVFGRHLVAQKQGGRMILTSSLFGVRGGVENAAYSASKFGMIGLMQCLAAELAPHNILVNAVCPGQVDSDMLRTLLHERATLRDTTEQSIRQELERRVPLGRLGSVDDIAEVFVFLASGLNRYMTGQSLVADGGWQVGPG